jgi:hypothetical protein
MWFKTFNFSFVAITVQKLTFRMLNVRKINLDQGKPVLVKKYLAEDCFFEFSRELVIENFPNLKKTEIAD